MGMAAHGKMGNLRNRLFEEKMFLNTPNVGQERCLIGFLKECAAAVKLTRNQIFRLESLYQQV